MIDYGKVRSTVKPDEIVIDEFSVWQHTDIQEVSENVGEENEFVGYEFNMVPSPSPGIIYLCSLSFSSRAPI